MNRPAEDVSPTAPAPIRVSRAVLFWAFVRVAALTLGGGFAMAAVMRHELVHKRRWLSEDEFFSTLSTATAVPGPVAVNLAFLEGRRLGGRTGAATTVLAMVLPSFLAILLIVAFVLPYLNHPQVGAFFKGCAVAVAGQIAFAACAFARRLRRTWQSGLICAAGLAVVVAGWHPVWAILLAAGLGFLICRPGPPLAADVGGGEAEVEEIE